MATSTPLSDENDVYRQPNALTITSLNNQTAWQHTVAYPFDEYQLTGTRQQSSATGAVDVFGMAGDDRLESAYGNNRLYGEGGNDVLSATAGVLSQQTSASLTYFSVTIEEEIEFVDQDLNGIEETIIHEHKIYEPLGSQSYQQLIETPFWSGQDQLFGGDGNDQLFGGGSGDALYGGADHDHLYGAGEYIQTLNRREETINRTYEVTQAAVVERYAVLIEDSGDLLDGGAGNDVIDGGAGADVIRAGSGDDQVSGGATQHILLRTTRIVEDQYADQVGGAYIAVNRLTTDTLQYVMVESGDDWIQLAEGNDQADGDTGNDTIYGGTGNDRLTGGSSAIIEIGQRITTLELHEHQYDQIFESNTVVSKQFDEQAVRGGDDLLYGGEGHDELSGGDGADQLWGGAGDDVVYGGQHENVTLRTEVSRQHWNSTIVNPSLNSNITQTIDDQYDVIWDGENVLSGGSGNDQLYGGGMQDQIYGGSGNDTIEGGLGYLVMEGSEHQQTDNISDGMRQTSITTLRTHRYVGDGDDLIYGGSGQDHINGADGHDHIYAGSGDDVLTGGAGQTVQMLQQSETTIRTVIPESANPSGQSSDEERVTQQFQGDVIYMTGGDDHLDGGAGNDQVDGQDGHDVINGQQGNDVLRGGEAKAYVLSQHISKDDTILWYEEGEVSSGETLDSEIKMTSQQELISGGNDDIYGGQGTDQIFGQDGDDHLYGGEDADELYGGSGQRYRLQGRISHNRLEIESGINNYRDLEDRFWAQDIYVYGGQDHLEGGSGDDVMDGGDDHDQLYGGDGNDTLYGGHDQVQVTLENTSMDNLTGQFQHTAVVQDLVLGQDILFGGAGQDVLDGLMGDDQLFGGTDDDILYGREGQDRLAGNAGQDILYGGIDNDDLYGGAGNDQLIGDEGDDYLEAGSGDDVLQGGHGNDTLHAGSGTDRLTGGEGSDALYGGAGVDQISGGAGDDQLYGGAGDDVIQGGSGADRLVGGSGHDQLIGGSGTDRYEFNRGDQGTTIIEKGSDQDQLVFDSSIALADLWWSRQGQDLQIDLLGQSDDRVTIKDWYLQPDKQIEQVQYGDGQILNQTQIQALVDAMAGLTPPTLVSHTFTVSMQSDVSMWG